MSVPPTVAGVVPGSPAETPAAAADDVAAQQSSVASRLNWLRAGVLGANDGIVSTAGLVVGVAAADPTDTKVILAAGVAGILAGAVSMAAGEYVSVSTQRDTEMALVAQEKVALEQDPAGELTELATIYEAKGLTRDTALVVARELSEHDAVAAHLEVELGLREGDYTNPWHAAASSAIAFTLGAMLPMLAILLMPVAIKIPATFVLVLVGLALTGVVSARLGRAPVGRAVVRVIVGGALAMAVTWGIGHLIGVHV